MFETTTDIEVFKRFWEDERDNTPLWLSKGNGAWHCTWEDFLDFCQNCERIYLIDNIALLYVESVDGNANIHFSVIRGHKVELEDLLEIRDLLLKDYQMIFGWCGSKNFGLKKLLTACQLKWYGFTMMKGWHRGKPLEWLCFSLQNDKKLLN